MSVRMLAYVVTLNYVLLGVTEQVEINDWGTPREEA